MKDSATSRVRWMHVVTFYVVACAVSWPFFWWRDIESESWKSLQMPGFIKTASYMWGPGVAAIVCFFLFRKSHQRTVSFAGTSWQRALLFYVAPLAVLAAVGGEGMEGMSGRIAPAVMGIISFFTIFGEELGWRGFLQDALRPLRPFPRYVLIGVMWEAWHFTNRMHGGSLESVLLRLAVWYPVVIVLSFIIGEAVERSGSLLVAHTLHCWVDLIFEMGGWQPKIVFAASLVWWYFLLKTWSTGEPWRPWPLRRHLPANKPSAQGPESIAS